MELNSGDLLKDNCIVELEKVYEERRKTIKIGENVILLTYLSGLLDDGIIIDVEEKLKQSKLELSRFDTNGLPQNALEDYSNIISISISNPIILGVLSGVLSNVVWESVKYVTNKIWINVSKKQYAKFTSTSLEKKNVTFGVEIKLDQNTSFNFRLDGHLSEEVISESLDKAISFLKEQKMNEGYKFPYFMTYDTTLQNWVKLDVQEEIMKRK